MVELLDLQKFKSRMEQDNNVVWKTNTNLEFLWSFDVAVNVDTMWSYISDTSRFNREIGLAPRTEKEVDGKNYVVTTLLGFPQEWIEKPWMWIQGETITSEREYLKGVAYTVQSVFNLQPIDQDKTRILIYFGWHPRNWFCYQFLSLTESMLRGNFKRVFSNIEKYVAANKAARGIDAYKKINHKISARQIDRVNAIKNQLVQIPEIEESLVDKLAEHILKGDELELDALKVIRLAHDWKIEYQKLLKICLHGSRLGLLNISWNLVCPHCKGSRFGAKSLGEIPFEAICEPCNVEFKASDEEAVEVIFKVHPSVREISEKSYCAAEPAKKSHIKTQQPVKPNSVLKLKAPILQGSYKITVKNQPTKYIFKVTPEASNSDIYIDLGTVNENLNFVGQKSYILFKNNSDQEVTFKLEELKLIDYALRPQHVLMYPDFRDLFANEHLKSDLKLHLGEQTLLFTDVVGSTAYYEKVGDAKAFEDVRKHFVEVFEIIKKHQGQVVKTIGDAVMATFFTVEDALAASEKIQKSFDGARAEANLRLRISIHKGVVIAVHLESGLDYFGSAINKCAKIQNLAGAGQIAMVSDVYDVLKTNLSDYKAEDHKYDSDKMATTPVKVVSIS